MKALLKQGRPESPPRPERLAPPPDVARTWCVAGVASLPLFLTVLSFRGTPIAQPGALFGLGLPLVCAAGSFAQRHRGLLVGSRATRFEWTLRLGGLLVLATTLGLVWRPHAAALLAGLDTSGGQAGNLDVGIVVSGPLDAALLLVAWSVGRRLYARAGLLEVQPWERGDEGLRMGRVRLVEGLWRHVLGGAVLLAAALWVLWARAATSLDRAAVTLLSATMLPLYLGAGVTMMARLTGVARRSGWALEGLTLSGSLPSPWSRATLRAAVLAAAVLGLVAISPLVGSLHGALFAAGAALMSMLIKMMMMLIARLVSGIPFNPLMFWPGFRWPPLARPMQAAQTDTAVGSHMLLSLLVLVVLSWVIWWLLVKLLDRLPAVAAVAREHRGRALLRLLMSWLTEWWRRGTVLTVNTLEIYRARSVARRAERHVVHLAGLAPRAAVLALYRQIVLRAALLGWRRPPGQTPEEFAARLRGQTRDDALGELTAAFLEARYSRHDIPPGRVAQALALWRRARRSLRARH